MKLFKIFKIEHLLDFLIYRLNILKSRRIIQNHNHKFFSKEELEKFDKNGRLLFNLEDKKIFLYSDSLLSKAIINGFEESEIMFVKKVLKEGDTFIDIGANIGLFSIEVSEIINSKGNIYSFEPSPITYKRCKENFELNNLQNVCLEQLALSNQKGELNFYLSQDGFDAWNGFSVPIRGEVFKRIKVDVSTLNDYFSKDKVISEFCLIKIDVEGWELSVLEGSIKFIEQYSPVFMIEFTEENAISAGYKCSQVYEFLEKMGYSWFEYNHISNELTSSTKQESYEYSNLIATKGINKLIERLN